MIMRLAPKALALRRHRSKASYLEALFVVGKSRRAVGDMIRLSGETRPPRLPPRRTESRSLPIGFNFI